MTQITRPCSHCYRTIPGDRKCCPWCGNGEEQREELFSDEFRNLVLICIFLVLLAAAAYRHVYYGTRIYPYEKVPVKVGEYKNCPASGANYDIQIKTILVSRMDSDKYGIKKIIACPPEALADGEKPMVTVFRKGNVDVDLLKRDKKANEVRAKYPKMSRSAAWFVGRGRLAIGMTKQQVVAVWGHHKKEDHFTHNGLRIERWYFGDPVYDLVVMDRFADFMDGKLVDFSVGGVIPARSNLKFVSK
jgi:hypothetical protein